MTMRTLLSAALALSMLSAAALAAGGGGGGGGGGSAGTDDWMSKPPEFRNGIDAIAAKDYRAAADWFGKAVAADPKDADAANYLGYSHRKLGDFEAAIRFYKQALALNPKHLGAYEYLGEAYLELKDLPQAKQQLAKLDDLCWLGCKEYSDLKVAVRKFEQGKG